jgi:hypothetical protein
MDYPSPVNREFTSTPDSGKVEPVFAERDQAINDASNRGSFRSGEIRILDPAGKVEETISFDEMERRL